MDFAFLGTKEHRDNNVTLFTATDIRTQMAMAITVPAKSVNCYALTELKRFIHKTGRTQDVSRFPCAFGDTRSVLLGSRILKGPLWVEPAWPQSTTSLLMLRSFTTETLGNLSLRTQQPQTKTNIALHIDIGLRRRTLLSPGKFVFFLYKRFLALMAKLSDVGVMSRSSFIMNFSKTSASMTIVNKNDTMADVSIHLGYAVALVGIRPSPSRAA